MLGYAGVFNICSVSTVQTDYLIRTQSHNRRLITFTNKIIFVGFVDLSLAWWCSGQHCCLISRSLFFRALLIPSTDQKHACDHKLCGVVLIVLSVLALWWTGDMSRQFDQRLEDGIHQEQVKVLSLKLMWPKQEKWASVRIFFYKTPKL